MTSPEHGAAKLDYDDYASMPDDGKRYEILDGDLAVTATPFIRHQRVSRDLSILLHTYAVAHKLGEIIHVLTVILDRHTIVQPDILFVSKKRSAIITERCVEGAPDLLIEILSPSTATRDSGVKRKLYARFGVDHYWLVDPDARMVEVFVRGGAAYRSAGTYRDNESFSSPLFPGLAVDLASVWG